MPTVYNLEGLVNSGITYLSLKGTIIREGPIGQKWFHVTAAGIQARSTENEEKRINK